MSNWKAFILLSVGVSVGWYGHVWWHGSQSSGAEAVPSERVSRVPPPGAGDNVSAKQFADSGNVASYPAAAASADSLAGDFSGREGVAAAQRPSDQYPAADATALAPAERLQELLTQQRFKEAVGLVYEVQRKPHTRGPELRNVVLAYLRSLLEGGYATAFTDLVDLYLAAFYDDIDALLLLADYNAQTDFYSESISVYQLAKEYAYVLEQHQKIDAAFHVFLSDVDQHLIARDDVYNLAQIYQQAELVGLLTPEQKLRQAEIYIKTGELYLAKDVLESLLSSKQSAEAKRRIAALDNSSNPSSEPLSSLASGPSRGLDLEVLGNQYVVTVELGSAERSRLLIDTGASMTTFSQEAFDRIAQSVATEYTGRRMFSTANGLVRGNLYRLELLRLGEFELHDHQVAVLELAMGNNVEGLLGMSTLGAFKFQFEHDKNQLLLQPR